MDASDLSVAFDKMEGAGNDFVFVDHRSTLIDADEKPAFARAVCDRKFGVGADGLVFIENDPSPEFAFAWDFLNADGSRAAMCGNASRCAARFALAHGMVAGVGEPFTFRTQAGPIAAVCLPDGGARVGLTDVPAPVETRGVHAAGQVFDGWFMDTGVPHFVTPVNDPETVDVVAWGRALRHHAAFAPGGTNVNFLGRSPDGSLVIRTYERGVEDETLACGTGATAAAIAASRMGGATPPVSVRTRGGQTLTIGWAAVAPDGAVSGGTLTGPARTVFTGTYRYRSTGR